MDFELTEEMRMLKDMADKFAQQEIAPLSHEYDKEEKYNAALRKKGAEQGLVAPWIPEEYGGSGVGSLGNALVTEALSRVDLGLGLNVFAAGFGSHLIWLYGTEEQKKKYLPLVASGEQVSAGAYTEPNAGTDVAGYKTRAVRDGKDFVINGNKMFITNGTVCNFMVVQAITEPDQKKHQSFSQIIVPADAKGVIRNKLHGKMGIRASDTAEITFEDVRVPQENLVGKAGRGFYQLMHFFDVTRIEVAAQAVGLSQGCLETAVKYSKERTAFGQPIINYQATQIKIAEMAMRVEALRNLVYKASWLLDQNRPDFTLSSMAKYLGGQTAVFCANAAVEIHGGYGYMDEYAVQKFYRDAKILELYEGTKEAEAMSLAKAMQNKY